MEVRSPAGNLIWDCRRGRGVQGKTGQSGERSTLRGKPMRDSDHGRWELRYKEIVIHRLPGRGHAHEHRSLWTQCVGTPRNATLVPING